MSEDPVKSPIQIHPMTDVSDEVVDQILSTPGVKSYILMTFNSKIPCGVKGEEDRCGCFHEMNVQSNVSPNDSHDIFRQILKQCGCKDAS